VSIKIEVRIGPERIIEGNSSLIVLDEKAQLSDIESSFRSIVGQASRRLLGLDGSAYYQPLLTLLIGIGIILHSFWLFLRIFEVKIKALLSLFVRN